MKNIVQLPRANERALGLRLTDEEWDAVLALCGGDEKIVRAWVFGSRSTGERTNGDVTRVPDIDVAIEPTWRRDTEGTDIREAADFKARHADILKRWNIEVDWHGLGDRSDAYHVTGTLIWPS
jgi:predicted nucleotidyltransferase